MDFSNIYITTFIQSIPAHKERLKETFQENLGEAELIAFVQFCNESVKNIGDDAFQKLTGKTVDQYLNEEQGKEIEPEKSEVQELEEYFITFEWVDAAKSFTLLLRDILIQHQKTGLLLAEQGVELDKVERLKDNSLSIINEAYSFLEHYFENSMKDMTDSEKKIKNALADYQLQENPWPIYREQFELIQDQIIGLKSSGERLTDIAKHFQEIKALILNTPITCKKEFEQFIAKAKSALSYVEDNMIDKSGKVATYLEDLENEIKLPPHLDSFTANLKSQIDYLGEKLMIPLGVRGGMIQREEIDFRRKINQWVDAEILPLLYEIWEHTEALEGNLKMSLINIRNRAIILSNETTPSVVEKEIYAQPLELYLTKAENWHDKMCALEKQIEDRMDQHFLLSPIFDAEVDFLPISMQSTFNNLDLGQNEVLLFFQKKYKGVKNFIRRVRRDVEKEETLSQSEKVVRAIERLSVPEIDSQYNSIFQTKGYVGESFWVGRAEPLRHFDGIINMWEKGFRGGVLLVGQRLAGKTLFGEKVANLHFPKNTIRVAPNSLIKVKSKKIISSYNLGEILDFIRNNTINEKALVWIDDLELWANESISLGQNVRALKDFMDTYSGQLFCMVSMSNWAKSRLKNLYQIDTSFQAEIQLDKMEKEEVGKAIMIRHGATHKLLVGQDGEELSAQLFQEKVFKVYKNSNGVIGDALNRWVVGTHEIDNEKVVHDAPANYSLPDFLTPDVSVLLTAIFIQKITTDYRLRRLFGAPYKTKYKSILRRLISLKLVTRNLDSTLEVNDCIANELAEALIRKKYL